MRPFRRVGASGATGTRPPPPGGADPRGSSEPPPLGCAGGDKCRAMAAAAALTGRLTDVRKFLGADADAQIATGPKLKLANPTEFLTDPVLPPPEPEDATTTATDAPLPATESSSKVAKFTVLKGIAAALHVENIDTDMITPARFLKVLKRTGLKNALFANLRFDANGGTTDFVLNREPYTRAKILICDKHNFGCGSSREHAPWALCVSLSLSS